MTFDIKISYTMQKIIIIKFVYDSKSMMSMKSFVIIYRDDVFLMECLNSDNLHLTSRHVVSKKSIEVR